MMRTKKAFLERQKKFFWSIISQKNLSFQKSCFFILNKKTDINISDFLLESKTVKKGRTSDQFSSYIFGNDKKVIGPITSKKGYHFFKILNRYEKGSTKGLEIVYDEIFQRLYKTKKKGVFVCSRQYQKHRRNLYKSKVSISMKLIVIILTFMSFVYSNNNQNIDGVAAIVEEHIVLKSDLAQMLNMSIIQNKLDPIKDLERIEVLKNPY